jgi:hypothetical protein
MSTIAQEQTLSDKLETINTICAGISEDDKLAKLLLIYELFSALDLDHRDVLLQGIWYTASEIGELLDISKNKVGRISNHLNMKADPRLCVGIPVRIKDQKYTIQWYYNQDGADVIGNFLQKEKEKEVA